MILLFFSVPVQVVLFPASDFADPLCQHTDQRAADHQRQHNRRDLCPERQLRDTSYHNSQCNVVGTQQRHNNDLNNTFSFGAEYDINKMLEISAGYQQTMYTQEERNNNDLSFNLNSWSFGLGVGVHISSAVKVNAGYFHTNYIDYTTEDKSTYSRTNNVIGVGVELSF